MLRTLFFLFLVCVCGCAQRGPAVQFVEGTVTLDGVAVADADVSFVPKATDGIPALGKTDENGQYRLSSAQGGEFGRGAVTGEYDVRIIKFVDPDYVAPINPQPGDFAPMARPRHQLPERYSDVKTSELTATVTRGRNKIDFSLTQSP